MKKSLESLKIDCSFIPVPSLPFKTKTLTKGLENRGKSAIKPSSLQTGLKVFWKGLWALNTPPMLDAFHYFCCD